MDKTSSKDEKNDILDCLIQTDQEEVTIKKEIVNEQEFSEVADQEWEEFTKEDPNYHPKGGLPEINVKCDIKNEEGEGSEVHNIGTIKVEKNLPILNDSSAEEESLELKEKTELEDIEFQSVGLSTSTGMVSFKSEDGDCSHGFYEQRMDFHVATEDSVSEEDPLEAKGIMPEGDIKKEVKNNTEEVSKKKNKEFLGETPFKCEHCQKTFSRLSDLKTHVRTHTGEKPFTCQHCQKSFSQVQNLNSHLRTHTGEKPFTCEHCRKQFAHLTSLKFHLRTHTGEKPFTCEHCQKQFSQLICLKFHLRTHTGEKPFTCEYCQKSYARPRSLKYHLSTHTGAKPFTCEHCQKQFFHRNGLKFHLRTHTGEKPFTCEHCKKKFSHLTSLKFHLRTHTLEKPLFTCEHCKKSFSLPCNLKRHLKLHTG